MTNVVWSVGVGRPNSRAGQIDQFLKNVKMPRRCPVRSPRQRDRFGTREEEL